MVQPFLFHTRSTYVSSRSINDIPTELQYPRKYKMVEVLNTTSSVIFNFETVYFTKVPYQGLLFTLLQETYKFCIRSSNTSTRYMIVFGMVYSTPLSDMTVL